jgi:hypothetical protein
MIQAIYKAKDGESKVGVVIRVAITKEVLAQLTMSTLRDLLWDIKTMLLKNP